MAWQIVIKGGKLWDCWNDQPRAIIQLQGTFPGYFWISGNAWGVEKNLDQARNKVLTQGRNAASVSITKPTT